MRTVRFKSSRRRFLQAACGAVLGALDRPLLAGGEPFFLTRGVVLVPEDLTLPDWPERARKAGLTTLALHTGSSPRKLAGFVQSEKGQKLLARLKELGLEVEYELHAGSELLPRDLFAKDKELFRMDEKGERTPDANLCVTSRRALEIASENALSFSRILRPTTGRYFLWGDDGAPWCRCPGCRHLPESDQALLLENRLLAALRSLDPRARLAHLAYARTLPAPSRVRPSPGVFLEFAPIDRRYDLPLSRTEDPVQRRHLTALDGNLAVFGREGSQALEYWLDASRFSKWTRPAKKIPFDPQNFAADLELYAARGMRHITSFSVFVDADYLALHGEPPLEDYGRRLREFRKSG
jgi:hypothetical protein